MQHDRTASLLATRAALAAIVDLHRHPDGGRLLVEPGASPLDDALVAATAALGWTPEGLVVCGCGEPLHPDEASSDADGRAVCSGCALQQLAEPARARDDTPITSCARHLRVALTLSTALERQRDDMAHIGTLAWAMCYSPDVCALIEEAHGSVAAAMRAVRESEGGA